MEDTALRPIRFTTRGVLVAVALIAMLLGLARYLLSWDLPPSTVGEVKAGMTMDEVEEIFGPPKQVGVSTTITSFDCIWQYDARRLFGEIWTIRFDKNQRVPSIDGPLSVSF